MDDTRTQDLLERKDFRFEFKADDDGTIEGYGSIFGNEDLGGDVVESGAFAETLKERKPRLLWQHDTRQPIGAWTELKEDKKGLRVRGRLALGTQQGREAHELVKMEALEGLSIGYGIRPGGFEYDTDSHVRRLKSLDLWEVSLVTFPMNELAGIDTVKARLSRGEQVSKRDLERILRDAGFSRDQSRAICAKGFDGLAARDADGSSEVVKAFQDSLKRIISNA